MILLDFRKWYSLIVDLPHVVYFVTVEDYFAEDAQQISKQGLHFDICKSNKNLITPNLPFAISCEALEKGTNSFHYTSESSLNRWYSLQHTQHRPTNYRHIKSPVNPCLLCSK